MNGLRSSAGGHVEDAFLVEIALGGGAGTDQVRLVGSRDVKGAAVDLGVDGDRSDAKLAQRAKDAHGDLAAVRHEHLREGSHGPYSPRSWAWPTSSPLGSLLDPVADKLLVLTVLIVLIDRGVFPGWMVAAIVAREFLVSGLRLAALERGVVMHARDLGKLKTWSQATAAAIGGFAAAGAWETDVAWWALLVALVLTWLSGLDYARVAPGLLRGRAVAR
jgi:CDP-diacylglycerol--glycerol-3-phosphate 3-phosphatidyltransferase